MTDLSTIGIFKLPSVPTQKNKSLRLVQGPIANLPTRYGNFKITIFREDDRLDHAMVFMGVNIGENGRPDRWRVENSWGKEKGRDGYYIMSDDWFDEYVFQVVVNKKYLPPELLNYYNQEPVVLEPWDPMGSLAD